MNGGESREFTRDAVVDLVYFVGADISWNKVANGLRCPCELDYIVIRVE